MPIARSGRTECERTVAAYYTNHSHICIDVHAAHILNAVETRKKTAVKLKSVRLRSIYTIHDDDSFIADDGKIAINIYSRTVYIAPITYAIWCRLKNYMYTLFECVV